MSSAQPPPGSPYGQTPQPPGGYGMPHGGYAPYGVQPPQRSTNTMAVVSLISGIAAWVFLPAVGALLAVITGHIARREIRIAQGQAGGNGLAIAGLILGYLNLALSLIVLAVIVWLFYVVAWNARDF